MALDKEEREELLSRQIADNVTASVEATLRRRYSWIGLVTAFVLGGLGYGLINAVVKDAAKSVIRSELVMDLAQEQIDEVDALTRQKLQEVDDLAKKSRDRLHVLEANITETQDRVEKRTGAIDELLAARKQDLQNLGSTADQITQLSARVKDLNEQVKALAQSRSPGDGGTATFGSSEKIVGDLTRQTVEIEALAQQFKNVQQRIETSRTTVFVQAAGFSREQIDAVTNSLSQAGYAIPGVELVKGGSPVQEVRYFYADDRTAAEQVAEATTEALRIIKLPDPVVQPTDMSSWSKIKPRQGTVELWLVRQ